MKLNTKKTIYVGFAFLIIQLFWQVYDNVIAKMLIDSFGLNQFASGIVMAVDNVLAVVLLPIFGALSDKTKTKHGKRTPYIFIGTIVAALLITGISVFDNLQNSKIKEAGIPGITSIEVTEIKDQEITYYGLDENGKYSNITVKTEELVNGKKVETLYKFDFDEAEVKYFEQKEDASNAREPFVSEIRDQNIGYLIGFLAILLVVLIAMSAFRTPAVSLMPDVTPKPLRSKGNAIINLMGAAGGIIALIYMTFTNSDYNSYTLTFIILSVLMIVFLLIFLFNVKENKLVEERIEEEKKYGITEEDEKIEEVSEQKMPKDVRTSFILILLSVVFWYMAYNAATSKFSVYATTVLDTGYTMPLLVAQGAAIISYIPIGIISSKIGRKKTVIAGVVILFVAFFLAIFVSKDTAILIWVALALAGIGWATINVNSYPMIVEMATGNNVGKYTGIYYTASMAAQIATPVLSGWFMDIFGMRYTLFAYSTIFSLLALITMLFVKHGDSKPIPKDALSTFEDLGD